MTDADPDSPRSSAAVPGPDGRLRCPWGLSAPEYVAYHDEEWGRPVRGDRVIFERLCLEAFQSGLSWLTILRKRDNFRTAFAGFDIATVAGFGADDVARLLADARIVRNRAKINATITNARAALELGDSLSDLVWSYAETEPGPAPRTLADLQPQTPASKRLAKELRAHGFVFTGPVTVYATMQACGLVNDHLEDCFARSEVGKKNLSRFVPGSELFAAFSIAGVSQYAPWVMRNPISPSFSRRCGRRRPSKSY
jgi:DNA-3-methyladenine glycosylase I